MVEKELYLTVKGQRLFAKHLRLSGRSPSGTSLVFLHEGLGSIAHWKDFPRQLCEATGCNGFLYDRIGYGKSEPVRQPRALDYLQREALTMLPEVLLQAGLNDVILIGHSDGGTIALLFAASYPKQVKAVITEAAHVFVEEISLRGIEQSLEVFEADEELMEKFVKYHGDHAEQILNDWKNIWLSKEFRSWNIESCLPEIKCPVLVIQGEDDEYGTVAQVDAIADQVSGAADKLLIPNCGHRPHHQAREIVLPEMARFIKNMID